MIKIRIKKGMNKAMLQEAMRVEDMGLPALIVTFIKEDIPKNREAQVRLGDILKKTILPPILVDALGSKFSNWQNFLQAEFEKTDESTDSEEEISNLIDRTTKLFQFLFRDIQSARIHQDYPDRGKPIDLKSIKGIRKSLTKNLKKFGWDMSAPKKASLFLDEILIRYYDNFIRDDSSGSQLIAFLNEHPDNQKDVADMTWFDASNFAAKYFIEKEDEDMIIKRYPKKNMFWYNIGKGSCSLEASRMGHCGRETETSNAVLFSLRRKSPGMKVSDSHVTISYVEEEAAVYQIKGKNNCHPEERYGPYVVDFLEMMEVEHVRETGQHSSCDFDEFLEYLEEKYPDAEYEASERIKLDALDDEIKNGDHNSENVQIFSNFDSYGDDYSITIHGNVYFKVPLLFLSPEGESDEQIKKTRKRFLSAFNDEEEDIKEIILEVADFDHLGSYDDMGSLEISYFETDDYVTVSFDISDQDTGGYAMTRDEAEAMIDNLKYSYERRDIDNYIDKVQEVIVARMSSVINPETAEKMQAISDKIDELDQGYNYFSVYEEDTEIYFETYGIPLPISVPQYPLPQGLTAMSNREKFQDWSVNSRTYEDTLDKLTRGMEKEFNNSIKKFHKSASEKASRQLSLTLAGMDLPPKKPELDAIPQFVDVSVQSPSREEIIGTKKFRNQEFIKPVFRIKFRLMVEISDDVSDIVWGMEYIDYLDKNLDNIMSVFAKSDGISDTQSSISKFHADLVRQLKGGLNESKRRIKIKIS